MRHLLSLFVGVGFNFFVLAQPADSKVVNYVCNGYDGKIWKGPSFKADSFIAGSCFKLVGKTGDWFIVELLGGGKGYLYKESIEYELQIPLNETDVNQGEYGGWPESDDFEIEVRLITREQFRMAKRGIRSHELSKNLEVISPLTDSSFSLRTKEVLKEYRNTIVDGNITNYSFLGEMIDLNVYVLEMMCQECEEDFYILVDKDSGKEFYFRSLPHFSADALTLIEINTNSVQSKGIALNYNADFAEVHFYSNRSGVIERLALKHFPLWALVNQRSMFWGNDNWFYVAILPSFIEGNSTRSIQFIRMRLSVK